jgi:cobalt-zinc-cadmium efflux system membrane fusion protein
MRPTTGTGIVVALALAMAAGCSKKREPAEGATQRPEPPAARSVDAAPTATEPPPHHDEPEQHEELPTKVRLLAAVVKAARIETAPATLEILPATVDLTGDIAADPDRSARLAARVRGRIVDVRVKEGERVKTGQVVAVLESPEIARARATLASALARVKSARLNADRLKNLEAKSLASGQETAAAGAEAAALEAEMAAAKQTLAALGQGAAAAEGGSARVTIRAPLAGFVLSRDAVPGQSVDGEHVIAVVGDLEHVYFLGRLFEKDLARVQAGAAAEVRLNAYPNEVFEAKVEMIGKQLDPAARTVTARIRVSNHDDLIKVGLFGNARVVTTSAVATAKRVVVPLTAVTRVANKDVLFVRQPDGDYEIHPVTTGRSAAGRVEILSGLRAGEQVVVNGVFTLKSAVLKSTFGEEE